MLVLVLKSIFITLFLSSAGSFIKGHGLSSAGALERKCDKIIRAVSVRGFASILDTRPRGELKPGVRVGADKDGVGGAFFNVGRRCENPLFEVDAGTYRGAREEPSDV